MSEVDSMKEQKTSWQEFDKACEFLARCVKENVNVDYITALPRGGLTLAVKLSNILGIPYIESGSLLLSRPNSRILFVDDIYDTGETTNTYVKKLGRQVYTVYWFVREGKERHPNLYYKVAKKGVWIVFPWEE